MAILVAKVTAKLSGVFEKPYCSFFSKAYPVKSLAIASSGTVGYTRADYYAKAHLNFASFSAWPTRGGDGGPKT
jgi:hypothetical protein